MYILSEENRAVNTDSIGRDSYYGVLDVSKPKNPDYVFRPVVFVETYQASSVLMSVGPYTVMLPFKWSMIMVHGDMAGAVPMEDVLPNRGHEALVFNPLSGFMPRKMPVRPKEYVNASWSLPSLDSSSMLVIPVGYDRDFDGNPRKEPVCIIAGEYKSKLEESVDLGLLL